MHLASLEADDHRALAVGEHPGQVVDVDPALVVGVHLDQRVLAEAEVADRSVDGVVAVVADDDPHARGVEEPPLGHVPARAGQDDMPGCGEARVVRHHPAGDEPDR